MSLKGLVPEEGGGAVSRRCFVLFLASAVLLYTVYIAFFYTGWLLESHSPYKPGFNGAFNISVFAASLIVAFLIGTKAPVKRMAYLMAGHAVLAAALVVAFVAVSANAFAPLFMVSGVIAGVGIIMTVPFSYEVFASYSRKAISFAFGVIFLLGMVFGVMLEFLPAALSLVVRLAVLMASALCYIVAFRQTSKSPGAFFGSLSELSKDGSNARFSKRDYVNTFLVPVICAMALAAVYSVLNITALQNSALPGHSIIGFQTGGIIAPSVFLIYFTLRKKTSTTLLFNVVFGILAAGILLLPFSSGIYLELLNTFVSAGWKFVMVALFYLITVTFLHDRRRLLIGIALAYGLIRIAGLLGLCVADIIKAGNTDYFIQMVGISFFLLYLILLIVWFINALERKKTETQMGSVVKQLDQLTKGQEDVRELRCADLAKMHDLTNRECEILYLLSLGRDTAFICETLYLSKNTVKSYQKSIYRKLEVHSKQAIIDLVQKA